MSGYCAIGSVERAMTPTSVMTMLITPAKIGRSMKKCGKFMPTAVAAPPSFLVLRLRGAFLCVRTSGGRFLRHWRNFHSRLQQLQTGRDHFLAVFQAVLHNSFSFEKTSGLKGPTFDRVVGFHYERVFNSLLRVDHSIGNQPSPIRRCPGHAHSYEKTRRDEIRVPVFQNDAGANRSRSGVKPVVNKVDVAFVWEVTLVPKLHPGRNLGGACAHTFSFLGELYVF